MGVLWNPWRHKSQKKARDACPVCQLWASERCPVLLKPQFEEGANLREPHPAYHDQWSLFSEGFRAESLLYPQFILKRLLYSGQFVKTSQALDGDMGAYKYRSPWEKSITYCLVWENNCIIRVDISLWPGCPLKNWFWIVSLFPFLIFCLHKFYYNLSGITA